MPRTLEHFIRNVLCSYSEAAAGKVTPAGHVLAVLMATEPGAQAALASCPMLAAAARQGICTVLARINLELPH